MVLVVVVPKNLYCYNDWESVSVLVVSTIESANNSIDSAGPKNVSIGIMTKGQYWSVSVIESENKKIGSTSAKKSVLVSWLRVSITTGSVSNWKCKEKSQSGKLPI